LHFKVVLVIDFRNGEIPWQLKIDTMKLETMDAMKKEVILLQISSSLYNFSIPESTFFLEICQILSVASYVCSYKSAQDIQYLVEASPTYTVLYVREVSLVNTGEIFAKVSISVHLFQWYDRWALSFGVTAYTLAIARRTLGEITETPHTFLLSA
jgi:hypothetical protein